MLTKSEMEKIWNGREIGLLKRNFCSRKKVKKFPVNYSVVVTKRVDTRKFSDIVISPNRSSVNYNSEVMKRIKELRTEYEKQYPDHLVSVSIVVGREV